MKHARFSCCLPNGDVVLTGGDHQGNGPGAVPGQYSVGSGDFQPGVWSTHDGTSWSLLHPNCPTTDPSGYPARNDNTPWGIDTKRGLGYVMPGFFGGVAFALNDCPSPPNSPPIGSAMTFNFSTGLWQTPAFPAPPTGYGGDNNSSWGIYDAASDSFYRYYWDGAWGGNVQILSLATNTWSNVMLGCFGGIATNCSGGIDSNLRNSFANRSQAALDAQGRAIYWITPTNALFRLRLDVPGHAGEWPPNAQAPAACLVMDGLDQEAYLVFDPIHRAVIKFCVPNTIGEIVGVAIYSVDTGQWQYLAAPTGLVQPVMGNAMIWSPSCNCTIITGGHTGFSENPALPNPAPNPCVDCTVPVGNTTLPNPAYDWQLTFQSSS